LSVNIVYWDYSEVFYKHIYASGAGSYDTRRLTLDAQVGICLDIATSVGADDQYVYVVYAALWPGNEEIMYKRLDNWGETGFNVIMARLTYSDSDSFWPSIGFDPVQNSVVVSYDDNWPGNRDVMLRRLPNYGADGFVGQRLSWGSDVSIYSSVSANSEWTFIAWQDNTSGNNEIYFKRGT
jgi:hypothetical protein